MENPHTQNTLVLLRFCELPRVWRIPILKIHWFCCGFASCREYGESPYSKYTGSAAVLRAAASMENPHTQHTLVLLRFCELPRVWRIPILKIQWFCCGFASCREYGESPYSKYNGS